MCRRIGFLVLLGLGFGGWLQAQTDTIHAVRFSIFDPVTLPPRAGNNGSVFSLHLFYGRGASVHGVDIGLGVSRIRGYVNGLQTGMVLVNGPGTFRGIQAGLLFNSNRGPFKGVQLGGNWSLQKGDMRGWQFSWFGNTITSGSMYGAQLSHLWNHAGRYGHGLQFALGVNSSYEGYMGVQVSLIGNMVFGQMHGVQWSMGVNWAGRSNGLQMGLVNVGYMGAGIQFGLVNYSGNANVAPVGLVNIVKKGYNKLEFWGNELLSYNVALKTGGERVYSILSVGGNPHAGDKFWGIGWGAGLHFQHSQRFYTDVDLLTSWLHVNRWWAMENGSWTFVNQLRMVCGFSVHKKLALFIGPVMNTLVSDQTNLNGENGLGNVLAPDFRTVRGEFGPLNYAWWPGICGGIRLF